MHPLLPELGRPGSRTAIRLGGTEVSHAEMLRLALGHAARMRGEGVSPGERVAVWATPEVPALAAVVGNALMGVATVPLNPALGERELGHVLRNSAPRLVLAATGEPFRERTPSVRAIALDGRGPAPEPPALDDPLLVIYTSGTTGPPKGAVLTHRNVAFDLDALARAWNWTADDVLVHALPLFHVHGLVLGVLGTLRLGGTLSLLPRFTPEGVCAAMGQDGTMLFAVPTMYHRLAEHGEASPEDARRLSRARLMVSGSAALPVRENDRLLQVFGQRPVERYGLTETVIVTAARHDGPRTPGTVGPPLPGIDLRLVDERRRPIRPGPEALGEVAVRGPNVFAGYLNRADATAAAMDSAGWFYTGDVATLTGGEG